MKQEVPAASWVVFDVCDDCGVGEGEPCVNLKTSTPKKQHTITTAHRNRKRRVYEP